MVNFTHFEAGTDESHWAASAVLQEAPLTDVAAGTHLLVVVAHPDDETLAAGGLIATVRRRGGSVDVIVASDGENSHPRSPTWTPQRLAESRRAELTAAMSRLGSAVTVHWLGRPDGSLDGHRAEIAAAIEDVLAKQSVGLLAATWRVDGHPDHEAVGQVTAGIAADRRIALWELPIWLWHWGRDSEATAPWTTLRRLELGRDVQAAKRSAMAEHRTQVAPLSPAEGDEAILPAEMTAHFERSFEAFFVTGMLD